MSIFAKATVISAAALTPVTSLAILAEGIAAKPRASPDGEAPLDENEFG